MAFKFKSGCMLDLGSVKMGFSDGMERQRNSHRFHYEMMGRVKKNHGILLLSVHLAMLPLSIFAQKHGCATEDLLDLDRKKDPGRLLLMERLEKKPSARIIGRVDSSGQPELLLSIPVVVHVIHNEKSSVPNFRTSTKISDDQVLSQIRVLNEDFRRMSNTNGYNNDPRGADAGIEFCLASLDPNGHPTSGINKVYHPNKIWQLSDEAEMKALSYWPSDQYLNIWVANLDVSKELGYARYPYGTDLNGLDPYDYGAELDGVVINYLVFGTVGTARDPYNLGRTATHEVGHWLGLRHIWGDDVCGDDYVDDTPLTEGPNEDNDCVDSSFCTTQKVADMTNNYLEYSPDRCMNLFTEGQKQRMWEALNTSPRRQGLFVSKGCAGPMSNQLRARVFPIPASKTLQVELYGPGEQSAKIEWYSVQGSFLGEENLQYSDQKVFSFDVSDWLQGMYFLRITNASGKKTVKIIIEH
jgi:hypothetical protein